MKKILLLLLLGLPLAATAQTQPNYLTGAIQLEEKRVTFHKEIQATGLNQEQLYETMQAWAANRFQPDGKMNARVLFSKPEEGTIAIGGEEWLVFTSSALSLDRSRIYYQLLLTCQNEKVTAQMGRIRYWYDEARNGGERYTAEEWITDEMALNKAQTKLAPITGKFRRETINLKEELFTAIQTEIGNKLLSLGYYPAPSTLQPAQAAALAAQAAATAATPAVTTPAVGTPATTIGTVAATPLTPAIATPTSSGQTVEEKIATATRITLTASGEQFELEKAYWGGLDQLFGKKVASFLLDQSKKMSNMLLQESDSYTLRFYPAGAEIPSVTLECKKLMTQPQTGEEAKTANALRDAGKSYQMYIGQIVELTEAAQ